MALYRKYRPASFAEVVGQEHVTEPLSVALSSGRINHAYLFSGPRGCGKTSSARILARSLNCVQGPTATPCGECDSCVALAPGGHGTLDVTELDAASHGGVDDTRDLRERAFFAPASSRYRVLIIDEAHMVTNAGFNALLKIVEEPPEHLIFIFATTEPEKVLPTIRSRTHHYPFRLLTPSSMRGLIERISAQEGVKVDPTVFPLVIRAGGGSPRDTLSVLDQLMAGAGDEGITYPRAVSLLGATEVALIDDTVDALAVGDGATLFRTVDKVVEAGHDPRRFATDLLQRLRDLIMVQSVPQAIERGLVEAPVEQSETMHRQAAAIGPATLARCADMVHEGLGSMRGATSPRLLLEILCAKLLLPAADESSAALLQRIESLEAGRPAVGGGATAAGAAAVGGGGAVPSGASGHDDDTGGPGPGRAPTGQSAGAAAPAEGRPKFVRRSQQQAAAAQSQAPQAAAPAAVTPAAQATPTAAPQAAPTEQEAPAGPTPTEPVATQPPAVAAEPPAPAEPPVAQAAPAAAPPAPPAAQHVPPAAQPVDAPDPAAAVVPGQSVAAQQAAYQAQQESSGGPATSRAEQIPGRQEQAPGRPEQAPGHAPAETETPRASAERPVAPPVSAPSLEQSAGGPQTAGPADDPWGGQPAEQYPPQQELPQQAARRPEADHRPGPAHPGESSAPGTAQATASAPTASGAAVPPAAPPVAPESPSAPAAAASRPPAEEAPDPAARSGAAAGAGTRLEAEDIRRAWPAIREAVRTRTRTVEVMLAGATVAGVDGQVIHLVHDYAPLAKRLSQPHNATAITDSITEVVGGEWTIVCTSGGMPAAGGSPSPAPAAPASSPAGPAAPQGETPAPPQQPEPRGWERRLQARAGGQSGGSGDYDDIPPPPEEPEPSEPHEPPPPPVTEDEMVDEARSGPQNLDHRTGEDLALALLKEHLGARPLER